MNSVLSAADMYQRKNSARIFALWSRIISMPSVPVIIRIHHWSISFVMNMVFIWSMRQTWNPMVPGMWRNLQRIILMLFLTTNRNGWIWCLTVPTPCIRETRIIRQSWSGPVEMNLLAEKIFMKCLSFSVRMTLPVWYIMRDFSMTAVIMIPVIWKARCIRL